MPFSNEKDPYTTGNPFGGGGQEQYTPPPHYIPPPAPVAPPPVQQMPTTPSAPSGPAAPPSAPPAVGGGVANPAVQNPAVQDVKATAGMFINPFRPLFAMQGGGGVPMGAYGLLRQQPSPYDLYAMYGQRPPFAGPPLQPRPTSPFIPWSFRR